MRWCEIGLNRNVLIEVLNGVVLFSIDLEDNV